jgi:hypothetical protein
MKIPVKSIEMVEVTTLVEQEVVKDITIPDIITKDNKYFQEVIDYLLTLEFVASSAIHDHFHSFPSYKQGGSNTLDLNYISIFDDNHDKLTIEVRWGNYSEESDRAIIIFKLPKKD